MPELRLRQLPLGFSSWSEIRANNFFFVDKTAKLADLVWDKRKVFFARPNGMGKTLLCSMLKELFAHGTQEFEDTAIYDEWPEAQCYPVISLSFTEIYSDNFELALKHALVAAFVEAGFEQAQSVAFTLDLNAFLHHLDNLARDQQLVFLIDDWDSPLTLALENDDLDQGRTAFNQAVATMRELFTWLKHRACSRFIFITGVMRFRDDLFFIGEDFMDLSMEPDYADLIGFTPEEVEVYYAPYYQRAAQVLDTLPFFLVDDLKQNYGGYCFDYAAQTELYNPLALNEFFATISVTKPNHSTFDSYWMANSLVPRRLHDYLQRRKPTAAQVAQLCTCESELAPSDFMAPTDFDSITLRQILVQTGLWSIRKRETEQEYQATSSLTGGITNFDVARHYIPILTGYLLNIDANTAKCYLFRAQRALQKGNIALTCIHLNELLCHLPPSALSADATQTYYNLLSLWLQDEDVRVLNSLSGLVIIAREYSFMVEIKLIPQSSSLQLTQLEQLKQRKKPISALYFTLSVVQLFVSKRDHQILAWEQHEQYSHQQGRLTLLKPDQDEF